MKIPPKRPTSRGPSEWFTGEVYIDFIAEAQGPSPLALISVHFPPGARTAWHRHSIGQTLYVTEGQGRVQSRGEAVLALRPGDVVQTPGQEWHWHGAAPEHFMTHLSVTEGEAEWGEQVSDGEYHAEPG